MTIFSRGWPHSGTLATGSIRRPQSPRKSLGLSLTPSERADDPIVPDRQRRPVKKLKNGVRVSVIGRFHARRACIAKCTTLCYIGATSEESEMASRAKKKDHPISMRLPETDIAIIDRAADL